MMFAESAARYLKVPVVFAATDEDGHPTGLRRGFGIHRGDRVLIVHDVLSMVNDVDRLTQIIAQNHGKTAGLALFASYSKETKRQLIELIPNTHIMVELRADFFPEGETCPLCAAGLTISES